MGQLEDDVKRLIKDKYASEAEFARSLNLSPRTLYSALRNGLANSTLPTVVPIAEALDIDPVEIYHGRIVTKTDSARSVPVPLYGSISAGSPAEPSKADDVFPIPARLHDRYPHAFMLRVEGNSMNRVFANGSYVLVAPCSTVDIDGGYYVVIVGESAATVKRVRLLANGLELLPESDDPTYHPILFDRASSDAPRVSVIGQVVWHCPPVE